MNQEASMKNAESGNTWETVMRVVYPVKDAEQTLPLYVIDWTVRMWRRPRWIRESICVGWNSVP